MNPSITKHLRLLVLVLATSVLIACGGDSDSDHSQQTSALDSNTDLSSGDSTSQPDSDPDPSPEPEPEPEPESDHTDRGITGTVDGVVYNFTGDMRYVVNGDSRGIQTENLSNGAQSWSISAITPAAGSYHCDATDQTAPSITLHVDNTQYSTHSAGGACTLTVTVASSTELTGYFSGVLTDVGGTEQLNLSNGAFRIAFEDSILDLDEDGISDAEDNCPFDANPDQLDDDQNRVGNACQS